MSSDASESRFNTIQFSHSLIVLLFSDDQNKSTISTVSKTESENSATQAIVNIGSGTQGNLMPSHYGELIFHLYAAGPGVQLSSWVSGSN